MGKITLWAVLSLAWVAASRGAPLDQPGAADTSGDSAERMAWWKEAKFGMFIHWGVYSQAGGEWNGETHHAEWLQLTAKIPLAEYTAYARTFNPERFHADQWVKIAKDAGMKYLVITSKHHDGFAMFNSPCNAHNIVKGSAFGRDPIQIHVFEWPAGTMELPPVEDSVTRAYLLADPEQAELKVIQTDAGVSVSLPEEAPSKIASVLCLELTSKPNPEDGRSERGAIPHRSWVKR